MARYDVFWNAADRLHLLDVQNDLIAGLSSRVVIPLLPSDLAPKAIHRLNPGILFADRHYVLMTDMMAAVPTTILGEAVGNVSEDSDTITAALDMLFFGF